MHEDGSPHLHLWVKLKSRRKFSGVRGLETLRRLVRTPEREEGQQGNFQLMRNIKDVLKYVTKGGDYLPYQIDVEEELKAKKKSTGKCTEIVSLLQKPDGLQMVMDQHPAYLLQHSRSVLHFLELRGQLQMKRKRTPTRKATSFRVTKTPTNDGNVSTTRHADGVPLSEELQDHLSISQPSAASWILNLNRDESFVALERWLTSNLLQTPRGERPPRTSQLYLWGPPGTGKSRMINELSNYFRIYYVPTTEDFYDYYNDEDYDIAVIEEFKAQKTIQWMNQWLDGQPMIARYKGGQRMKFFNIPTIILSNFELSDCYNGSTTQALNPLFSRLEIINMTQNFWLHTENEAL
jgi:hypothetical protein